MNECLTISSMGWKILISLSQVEPIYTYSHQYTRHFRKEARYGGRIGAYRREFNSSLFIDVKTYLQSHLKPKN